MADWTTRIVVRTPRGIVCVRNDTLWHLPGGKKEEHDQMPWCTGMRELREETGLDAESAPHRHIHTVKHKRGTRGNRYTLRYFEVRIPARQFAEQIRKYGSEGEEVRVISYARLRTMKNFEPGHLHFLKRFRLLKPASRRTVQRRRS